MAVEEATLVVDEFLSTSEDPEGASTAETPSKAAERAEKSLMEIQSDEHVGEERSFLGA